MCLNPGGWKLAATFATIVTSHTLDLMHMIKPIDKALANMLTEAEKKLHVNIFFPSLVSTLRAAFSSSLKNNFELQMSSFTSVWWKKRVHSVYFTHTQVDLNSKIDVFFSSIETKAWWCAGHKKIATVQLLCKWEKATLQKYTHTQTPALSHGIDIVRAKADASECELKTT